MSPARKPAANSARAAPAKSSPCPSGSKIGPGDISRRLALPGGVTLKPPNGGVSFCRRGRSDLRSSGSFASAAREVTALRIDAGEMLRPAGRGHRARDQRRAAARKIALALRRIAGFEES